MIRFYSIEPRHWWKALIQCETRQQQQQQQLQPDRKTSAASAYKWGAGWRAGHQHRTCSGCNSDTRNNNRQQMGNFSLVKKGQGEPQGETIAFVLASRWTLVDASKWRAPRSFIDTAMTKANSDIYVFPNGLK